MALRGLRKIEADVIRHKAGQAMEEGICVRHGDTVDSDTGLPKLVPAESGNAKVVGILGDKVIAKPTVARSGSTNQLKGIFDQDVYSSATPLFQEAGDRYVDEEVFVIRRGLVTTDRIHQAATPSGGLLAYTTTSGYLTSSDVASSGEPVGVWQSTKDSDGYAQLYVDIKIAA